MTTTQDRPAPGHDGLADPLGAARDGRPAAPPVHRGPLVAAAVVLLLWGAWLLVPGETKADLLGAPPAGAPGPDAAPGAEGAVDGRPALDGAAAVDDAAAAAGARLAAPSAVPSAQPSGQPSAPAPAAPSARPSAGAAARPGEVPVAGDGSFAVAPGTGAPVGDGRLVRYTVEVEGGLPLEAADVAEVVEAVLADPRSWAGDGTWALQRVDSSPDARVVVASPATTDRMCAPLRTRGEVSCRNGDDVVLNAERWTQGATTWGDDVDGYRQYLVNHELGHYLGHGHLPCPADGEPAPVMLQQTVGLQGCAANAWPHP